MSFYPRTATIRAIEDSEIFEVRRNVLYMLQRDPVARELLDRVYRERALGDHLRQVPLFKVFDDATREQCIQELKDKIDLVRVDPGQVIFRQGEPADHFYLIRVGYVKFTRVRQGQEQVLDYFGPNRHFGEIAIVAQMGLLTEEDLPTGLVNVRTATCRALDDVELVRIKGEDFKQLVERFPAFQQRVVQVSRKLLGANKTTRGETGPSLENFLGPGAFQRATIVGVGSGRLHPLRRMCQGVCGHAWRSYSVGTRRAANGQVSGRQRLSVLHGPILPGWLPGRCDSPRGID